MYSRTALFLDAFAQAFTDADEVVIADIFASRDTAEAMRAVNAADLADAIERASGIPAIAAGDTEATAAYVADHLREGDAVLVMGAGKSYRIALGLAAELAAGVLVRPRLGAAGARRMMAARAGFMGAVLALAVAICEQGLVRLVDASGARISRPDPRPAAGGLPGRAHRGDHPHAAPAGRHGTDGAGAGLGPGPPCWQRSPARRVSSPAARRWTPTRRSPWPWRRSRPRSPWESAER